MVACVVSAAHPLQPGVRMRKTGKLLTLLLSGVLASSAGCATQDGDDTGTCEGKCDGVNVTWSDRIQNIVPKAVQSTSRNISGATTT